MSELRGRAQRFAIQMLLRYQKVGGEAWFEGRIENISRSGVLFRTEHVLEPRTAVRMSFNLPVSIGDDGPSEVFCRGSVVRTVPATESKLPGVAAAIRSYLIVRGHHQA